MIINGLRFTQNPIYLSPTFFEGKDVCALIGEDIEVQNLNDDVHGRTLDAPMNTLLHHCWQRLLMRFHRSLFRLQADKTGT